MRKTCFEMLRQIAYDCGLIPNCAITSFNDSTVTDPTIRNQALMYLNRAKSEALRKIKLDTVQIAIPFTTVASYSTGTVSIGTDDTTVTGVATVFTAAMLGRKIRIGGDNTSYQIIKYTSALSIEIDRPFVGQTATGVGFTIFQDIYTLSPRLSSLSVITLPPEDDYVEKRTSAYLETRYPDPLQNSGYPEVFSIFGELKTTEGAYTAAAGTVAGSIVYPTLNFPNIQNYYQDWYVYNSTRGVSSRISAYDVATTTLTLETPITGQTTSDSFILSCRQIQVMLRPAPLTVYTMVANGYKDSTYFVNDYDYEYEIDGDFEDCLIYQAIADFYRPKQSSTDNRAEKFQAMANDIYDDLNTLNQGMGGMTSYEFSGGRSAGSSMGKPWYGTYSRHEPF